jgi:hypothetical protein
MASTTTSTLSRKFDFLLEKFTHVYLSLAEFFYATDYAHGPMIDDNTNQTSIVDLPMSIPHCSDTPGIDILWESDDSSIINEYSLHPPRQWFSISNRSDSISPLCNKYQISCHRIKFDLLILLDLHSESSLLIQTFLTIFFSLIEPFNHRFSLLVLSSTTIDTFQYHLPLTSSNKITNQIIATFLSYSDYENNSTIQLNEHIQRASEYLLNHPPLISNISSQQILFTISSRLNFNQNNMKTLIQRYSTIRYMTLDPYLKTDNDQNQDREKSLRSLTSSPSYSNLFWSYSANRDLTFNTVFRVLESLCGYLR